MASISPSTFPSPSTRSDPNFYKFTFQNIKIPSRLKRSPYSLSRSHYLSRNSDSTLCLCHRNKNDSDNSLSWDSAIREVVRNAVKWFDDNASSYRGGSKDVAKSVGVLEMSEDVDNDDEDWDWDRWRKHFDEVDEQERVVSVLKSRLAHAVSVEEFEDASNLKVAIAAAATNDTVGRVMSHFNRAIKEEHYRDAAFVRDYAGAGLVGWWAGIAEDTNDPYGCIIRISAEHGRYVARSYSSRQLATATAGIPLFEIYLIVNKKGEYKHQVVYLRRLEVRDFSVVSSESLNPTGSLNPLDSTANKTDPEDSEDRDADSIMAEGLPGVKFKVLNVAALENAAQDLISKVIEQMNDHGDEVNNVELGSVDIEDDNGEGDQVQKEPEINGRDGILDEERGEIVVTCISDGLVQKVFSSAPNKRLIRVPATLEKKGRLSFSFSVGNGESQQVPKVKGQTLRNKKAKHGIHHVMYDLSKFKGRGKIPIKVLKDIGELIAFTLSRAQNRPLLSGSTTFNRIQIPASSDPLNGLYIGAGGLYSSEVIHLRRKVGQWEEDGDTEEPLNPEFYEYVEAVKITGNPYVPAGQVAFRAKVGKRYLLPHKGIIPEEFGVIARYKGEGRFAEPGFLNPRWVDGELVILDEKLSKRGPVVMFMYSSPEYHFSVFFDRLRLQE